jgi:hypothetical protein
MANQAVAYDEWECEFVVDFRSADAPSSERAFVASCERSGQEKFATQERFRRRGGHTASGMHRRGTRRRAG